MRSGPVPVWDVDGVKLLSAVTQTAYRGIKAAGDKLRSSSPIISEDSTVNSLVNRMRSLVQLLWREVAKFGAVGGVAFIIEAGLTWILVHTVMDGSDAKARIVGALVATLFAWIANRLWTFRNRRAENKWSEFAKFLLVNLVGMAIAAGFTYGAKYWLHIDNKNIVWMFGNVGVVVATIMRFFVYRFWIFNREMDTEPEFKDDHRLLADVTR